MGTVAAIDIGSNAIRMIIGRLSGHRVKYQLRHREPIRLGRDVFRQGSISKKNFERSLALFETFQGLIKKHKVDTVKAVATSAVREAVNGKQFIASLHDTGIPVKVINYQEEAKLIHLAVEKQIDLQKQNSLLIDIGGGSVELTFTKKGDLRRIISLPLGTVRLIREAAKNRPAEIRAVLQRFRKRVEHIAKAHSPEFAVGTGGNFECIRQLKTQVLGKSPSQKVSLKEIRALADILGGMTTKKRLKRLHLRKDRADVILPAVLSVEMMMEASGVEKLIVPKVGLRDGLLLSAAKKK